MRKVLDKLIIPSDVANIGLVEKLIDEISVQYELHDDVYGKVLLAVIEAVNNSIVHGNQLDPFKMVDLSYTIEDQFIQFVVSDAGSGFDLNRIPDPTKPENIEKTHGRGIFLMNHLADEIEFLQSGSMVRMKFNLL